MTQKGRQTVLYVLNSASTGGANRSLSVLLAGLDRAAYRPLAVVPKAGPFTIRLRDLDVPSVEMPLPSLGRFRGSPEAQIKGAIRNSVNLLRLGEFCEREAVSLVHTNTIFPLGGALAAHLAHVPHVWHLREGLDTPQYDLRLGPERTAHLIAALSSRLICISEYVKHVSVPEEARSRARVIHNALEATPPLRSLPTRREPVLGTVGLLGEKKRTRLFVEVAARVAQALPHARFIVAGRPTAGEEGVLSECRQRVAALGLDDRFEWPGFVTDPEEIYRHLDLLIHPGVHEAFGRVLIEAMARGIPVVSVNSGAVTEIVEDGITGRIVPPDDVDALAEATLACLERDKDYRPR